MKNIIGVYLLHRVMGLIKTFSFNSIVCFKHIPWSSPFLSPSPQVFFLPFLFLNCLQPLPSLKNINPFLFLFFLNIGIVPRMGVYGEWSPPYFIDMGSYLGAMERVCAHSLECRTRTLHGVSVVRCSRVVHTQWWMLHSKDLSFWPIDCDCLALNPVRPEGKTQLLVRMS